MIVELKKDRERQKEYKWRKKEEQIGKGKGKTERTYFSTSKASILAVQRKLGTNGLDGRTDGRTEGWTQPLGSHILKDRLTGRVSSPQQNKRPNTNKL